GNVQYFQSNYPLALQFYERAAGLLEAQGNQAELPGILMNVALCEMSLGRMDRAVAGLTRALRIAEERKLPAEAARAHYNIAGVYQRQKRWAEALAELQISHAAREAIGDQHGLAENIGEEAQ